MPISEEKKCSTCAILKPLSEYYKSKRGYLGGRSSCKACENAKKKEYCKNNKEAVRAINRGMYLKNSEKYRECSKKYYSENKDQAKKSRKIYYDKNKPKVLESVKKYSEKNKEKIKASQKKYYLENKEKFKEYRKSHLDDHNRRAREYNKRKMNSDGNYVIKKRITSCLKRSLDRNNQNKENKTSFYLGCSVGYAANYLKSLEYDKYTDDIDHIVPVNRFDLSQYNHRLVVFNYKNLQPLESSLNRSKQDDLEIGWKEKIIEICNSLELEYEPILKYIYENYNKEIAV